MNLHDVAKSAYDRYARTGGLATVFAPSWSRIQESERKRWIKVAELVIELTGETTTDA